MTVPPDTSAPGHHSDGHGEQAWSAGQRPDSTRPSWLLWAAVGVAAVVVVAVGVVIAVTTNVGRGHDEEIADQQVSGQVRGDRADWIAAVCADGSVLSSSDSTFLPTDPINVAHCMGKQEDERGLRVSIMIGEWPREVMVGQKLARLSYRQFAAAPLGDRTIAFAPTGTADRSVLEPLAAYGFAIVSLM